MIYSYLICQWHRKKSLSVKITSAKSIILHQSFLNLYVLKMQLRIMSRIFYLLLLLDMFNLRLTIFFQARTDACVII
jgi:hypothetical protein